MALTPERWQRLDELFNAAIALSDGERKVLVDRETASDPDLGAQLAGMLAHAPTAGERIAGAIGSAAGRVDGSDEWIGRHFGPYRIVGEIGRGGMGLVFEAVRDDQEYDKRVALKVAPWWPGRTSLKDRFKQERQILAGLEHPRIARLLDGGTSDGVPYFVMELVEGVAITEYCAVHQLDTHQRIELFRRVAAAVVFAHEHLIVHRDLKPGNILVGPDGEPKLLDFGIAKILATGADDEGTLTSETAWTPGYTSPEQIRGRPITVRTDVYSLGLILYELLTGARAQPVETSSPLALDRFICEVEPPAPSDQAALGGDVALARRLRGDLDTIVQTAIHKEPEKRYESVAAFSEDLRRHLDGHPIVARPSTFGYRAGKFLRRHRAVAAATLLLAISIAAGFGATVYQARRAERRFQQVRSLANAFVFDVHDRIERLPGSTEARMAIVQTALTYLESLRSDIGSDKALALELAAAYEKIGNVQGNPLRTNLGDTTGALASLTTAADLVRPVAAGGDRRARLQLSSVQLRLATVTRAKGDRQGAASHYGAAIQTAESLLTASPDDREVLALAGEIHSEVSRVEFALQNYKAAETSSLRTMELAGRLVALDPSSREYQNNLASAHNAVGAARIPAGRLAEAAESYRASVAIRERLVGDDPNNTSFQRNLLIGYGSLGDVLGYRLGENLGDLKGAQAAYLRAVELATLARTKDPADRRAVFDLANVRLRLGSLLVDDGEPVGAVEQLEESARLIDRLLANEPNTDRYVNVAIVVDRRLGDAFALMKRPREAIAHLLKAREASIRLLDGPNGPGARQQLVMATAKLALLYAEAGDPRASTFEQLAAAELLARPIDAPGVEAVARADLARAAALRVKARARN
jgi:non-specific serine/threonine protein kinase/serine/threonine-protein kinase